VIPGGAGVRDRLPEGLRLNAAGAALLETAEQLEDAALALERRHAATSPALSGTVRVSVGEWAAGFLARHLPGRSNSAGPPKAASKAARRRPIVGWLNPSARPAARKEP
jgi:hypothetical protein